MCRSVLVVALHEHFHAARVLTSCLAIISDGGGPNTRPPPLMFLEDTIASAAGY